MPCLAFDAALLVDAAADAGRVPLFELPLQRKQVLGDQPGNLARAASLTVNVLPHPLHVKSGTVGDRSSSMGSGQILPWLLRPKRAKTSIKRARAGYGFLLNTARTACLNDAIGCAPDI